MDSGLLAPSALSPASPSGGCGCVFMIHSDPAHAQALTQPARAALAVADAVLYDDDVAPEILALVPQGAFVESVASNNDCAPTESPAIARTCKLASEGWRVVWLVTEYGQHSPAALAAAGGPIHVCTDVCAHEPQVSMTGGRGPRPLATAFNGLAG